MRTQFNVRAIGLETGSLPESGHGRGWTLNGHAETLIRVRTVGKHGWPTAGHIESLATTAGR